MGLSTGIRQSRSFLRRFYHGFHGSHGLQGHHSTTPPFRSPLPTRNPWFKFLAAGHDRGAGEHVFDDLRRLSGAEWKHGPERSRLDGVSPYRRRMGAAWIGEGGRGAQRTERPTGWEEWKRLPATHWPSPPSAFARPRRTGERGKLEELALRGDEKARPHPGPPLQGEGEEGGDFP